MITLYELTGLCNNKFISMGCFKLLLKYSFTHYHLKHQLFPLKVLYEVVKHTILTGIYIRQ